MFTFLLILETKTLIKFLQILIISSVKFLFAPPISIEMGLSYIQTIAATTAGGILGIFFFYHLSGWLIHLFRKHIKPFLLKIFKTRNPSAISNTVNRLSNEKKHSENLLFTWKTKFFFLVKRKWGLIGICILTPTVFSIPIGSFLANKYYSKNKNTLIYLSISVFAWSLLISTFYFFTF